jgi:hypothetical protein
MAHARSASLTFDEGPHLAVGYATLRTGDLRLQPVHIHPPLANVLAAAPLLLQHDLPDPRAVEGWEIASLSAITDAVVWQYPHPERLALAGRLPIILMTLLLGAVIFRWANDLCGSRAGLLALALCAFDPNIIAHGSLVTTDMAVVLWGTLALFLTWRYLRGSHEGDHKGRPYLASAAVALGLALGSKVSALSLVLVSGLLWLVGPRGFSWWRRLLTAVGAMALAAFTLWAIYGFEVRSLPGFPFPLPAATHVAIYRALQEHYALGHPAFLLGQNRDHGWWYYFPVAFALKTPLPTLLLLVVSVVMASLRVRKSASVQVCKYAVRRWAPLVLFPVIYAISTPFSSVNIGYRHLLPLLPPLFIFVSPIANLQICKSANHESRITNHVLRFTFYVTLLWYLGGTLLISPNYLAYFNVAGGYRYLVDSNLDWGQNLWQLRDWMGVNGVERVYYAHFSPARPEAYGIQADLLPPSPRAVPFVPLEPAPGVYAIGATVLQGVYTPDVNTYAWFRAHEPLVRLGHALFVYRVEPRPAPAWAAVCANPVPTLSSEAVRAGLGRPDLRVVLFDCTQAWVYPAGEGPSIFVLPPGMETPPGATLEVAARYADGRPFYNVHRSEGALTPEQPVAVSVDGPLDLLGYRVNGHDYHPGDVIELWTFWRVREIPARPLSLMAHLTGADGIPVAVGDGLGVPVEQWQIGDVIVQRSRFRVTEAMQGDYQLRTGAYWLDTLERWPMQDEEGNLSDHVELAQIGVLH